MTFFDKYSVRGKFTNYSLESMLKDLDIAPKLISDILIRHSVSALTKEFIEQLKKTDENENVLNICLEYFLLADKTKPISCNKKQLSTITGLTERMIDEKRRAGQIPYIQLSGNDGTGRKIIVYDPQQVAMVLNKKVS
ncbi:MAG: hypothetical protein RBR23_10030 [Arcobacteraceae bacterium]|nr:hypothetical protein [Arcobacteraceae bacterium]